MRKWTVLAVILLLIGTMSVLAQTPRPNTPQTPRLTGRVLDPSGAVMFGVDVKVFQGTNLIKEAKTDERGTFSIELPAGDYRVEVKADDVFLPFQQNVRVPGPALTAPLKLASLNTTIDAGVKKDEVNIDEDANLTSTTLSGDKLKELPDDEDQLMAQLSAIAGGSGAAGANATFVIDGISGGKVPPKDQIQSIIIDTNVFSAEGMGGPRIQIITKPGTGPWSGNMNFMFNNQNLNARNPFGPPIKPINHQRVFNTSYGGPIIPGKLTLRFNVRDSKIENESSSSHAVTENGPVTQTIYSPIQNRGVTINGQAFLTPKTTLTFNLNYGENRMTNQGVSDLSLEERKFNSRTDNSGIMLSTRSILNTKVIFETRAAFQHSLSWSRPFKDDYQINVLGAFFGGGAQNKRDDHRNTITLGQTLRWTLTPKVNMVLGTDTFIYRTRSASETNYKGVYTFSSLQDWINKTAVTFRRTSGDPNIEVKQVETAAFAQFDVRMTPKLNLGVGLRYQAQTNFSDYNNVAPTFQLAYQVTKKTVLRAGGRMTTQPFSMGNVEQLLRFDGTTRQFETVITNPSWPNPFANGGGTTTASNSGSLRTKDKDIRASSNINSAFTIEQTLGRGWRTSASYDLSKGLNLIRTRNINAPYPGTPLAADLLARLSSRDPAVQAAARDQVDRLRPMYPYVGNINQFESTGRSDSKNLNLRLMPPNVKISKITVGGMFNYTYGHTKDNLQTQNQYDWNSDYTYSTFDARHRYLSFLNFTLPGAVNLGFFINGQSGNPYTVTTGRDENGDQSTNDRPAGYARNSERGPGRYNVDLNFNKMFTLKKAESATGGSASAPTGGPMPGVLIRQFADPQVVVMGPGMGPVMMPPPPGAPGSGGLKMGFTAQIVNVLNNTQLRQYNGIITSPFYGKSNTANDGRKIRLGLNFTF